MVRLVVIGCLLAGFGVAFFGCGDSGPSGPHAKVVEEFEDLGLSQEQAEAEVRAADREARQQIRREEKKRTRDRGRGNREAPPAQKTKQTPAQAAGFTGKYEDGYEIAVFVCGNYPLERIAKELHAPASAEPLEVAETYADAYWGRFQQAAFEGCFEGIMDRLGS